MDYRTIASGPWMWGLAALSSPHVTTGTSHSSSQVLGDARLAPIWGWSFLPTARKGWPPLQ